MIEIIALISWFIVLLVVIKFTYTLHHKMKKAKVDEDDTANLKLPDNKI